MIDLGQIDPARPVLIAGPTASGKSGLALAIAEAQGGVVINADAIQVFSDWRVLTARPSPEDEARAPHRLYGHVPSDTPYSVGQWLREVAPLLAGTERPIIVGGTGLYFTALAEGLAEIPETPADIRADAQARLETDGLASLLSELDARTRSRLDPQNPMRVMRAWEVQRSTGKPLAEWQDDMPAPLLPRVEAQCFLIDAPKAWLTPRIARRFDMMLDEGALDEARANAEAWSPALPSAKAIGAAELVAHVRGEMDLDTARDRAIVLTRQFAKRQRTWFRARMSDWQALDAQEAA
ncbi:tRNA (adenosine(37)-N6)-dimethylallyltransferase MiaA [Litorisediminicola beolgyonensis]|uniref:tRNA dimethylallyltransferase n=1 Tax=Litorisediminicola beolgyonensis TaxID=1173614 RepID=A0ABW3ZGG8_9RHOB